MGGWWAGLLGWRVPMALLMWAPDDAWALMLRPGARPPYARAAGRWPQVPGQMVTVSPRWAVAPSAGRARLPGRPPLCGTWRAPIPPPPPAGPAWGGGARRAAGAAGVCPR